MPYPNERNKIKAKNQSVNHRNEGTHFFYIRREHARKYQDHPNKSDNTNYADQNGPINFSETHE
jgi:hypothetical protein